MLFLFAGICQGQETIGRIKSMKVITTNDGYYIYLDTINSEIGESPGDMTIKVYDDTIDSRPIIRQDLIDYFQECKNDSTFVVNISTWRESTLIKGFTVIRDTVWIHNDPTFIGWWEWMEKRK
jgi:hypothetical protein